jgi:hypothetical protein
MSIFIGLLLNVVVLIFNIVRTPEREPSPIKRRVLMELLANILYSILILLVAIIGLILTHTSVENYSPVESPFQFYGLALVLFISNGICYYLMIQFLMILLMIVKRMYRLFEDEFRILNNKD